jgi:dipeptidyl aminopeptidase/acylaminoacyl peptidase
MRPDVAPTSAQVKAMRRDGNASEESSHLIRALVLLFAAAATACLASGTSAATGERKTLTPAERTRLMVTMRVSTLVSGGQAEANWFEDRTTFWFTAPEGSFFVDPARKEKRKLTSEEKEGWSAERPRSSDGRAYSSAFTRYVVEKEGDLWVHEDGDAEGKRLTEDAEEDVLWSATPEGWSSDETRLLALRTDVRAVHHLPIIDYSHPEESVRNVVYGKSGGSFMSQELAIFDLESGKKIVVDTRPDEDIYVFPIGWRHGESEILFLRLTRNAKRLDLMAADPGTGRSRIVLTETQDTFVGGLDFIISGWRDTFTPLEGTDRFLWLSERDGWRHIYLYSLDGGLVRRLTAGKFPVLRVEGVDLEKGRVFFTANGEKRLYDTNLYRVGLDGSGFKRLTDGVGDHAVQLAPSRESFVDTFSTPTQPPVAVVRNADGELLLTLSEADTSRLESAGWTPPEEFVVKADDGETDLYGVLYKPRDLDPVKKYPVIDVIYAGPFTTTVPRTFASRSFLAMQARAFAQLGFVTFMVDCRGTTERSKAFQDASYGRIGEIEIPDHVATLRQLAADRPYMDLDRVGITGGSWGGYFALRAMLTAPDVFHVGVARAPGDLTESPAINEPYMGLPSENPEGYAAGSNPALAKNLKGRLLIMHGTADENAPFSTTMRMAEALIRAGRLHDLAVFPQADHGFRGMGLYMNELMIAYVREHLQSDCPERGPGEGGEERGESKPGAG